MTPLKPKDSSILARVALYNTLTRKQREAMLETASTAAKKIGRVVIGSHTTDVEVRKSAAAFKKWAETNRKYAKTRRKALDLSRVKMRRAV